MSNARKYSHDLTIDLGDMIIADGEWAMVHTLDIYVPGGYRPTSAAHTDANRYVRAMHTERGSVFTTHDTLEEITAHAASGSLVRG